MVRAIEVRLYSHAVSLCSFSYNAMSKVFNYDELTNTEFYDRERYPAGADVIAGLLHVHCGKPLQVRIRFCFYVWM